MARSKSAKETLEFKADLRQVLEIITHSLYSHREVFLRELISNASDALDKLRFEALTRPELRDQDGELKVRISVDEDSNTLIVSDNGIGMSRDSIVDDLGTIAKSGTRSFLEKLKEAQSTDQPELIGQFGVGFYSAFMVADEITVRSRRAGQSQGVEWTSRGEGEFTLADFDKSEPGTEIRLHLREDAHEYLETHRLMGLVRKYSDFIEHPVVMELEKETDGEKKSVEERLNSGKAIWLRSSQDLSESDYAEFYKQLTRDFQDPLSTIHYSAEGVIEFKSLLFIPQAPPWEQLFGESRGGLSLYIQRVFIMDDCTDLLPSYLRFVRGVVDSADLPLNVSRELLQENALVHKIRKNLTKRILKSLEEMKSDDRVKYEKFYKTMGPVLKEGVTRDFENHDAVAELLLFESTRTQPGETTTLEHYVAGMPEDQEAIWYLIGEDRSQIENAPYLESFKSQGQEVLLLTDPVDEFLVHSLPSYKDKPLRAVDREETAPEEISELTKESYQGVLEVLNSRIEEVSEVRLSSRLRESASCLVAAEGALGSHMERLLEKMGREGEVPESKRILELNPEHAAVQVLRTLYEKDREDERLLTFGRLLYEEAVLAEGSRPKDPASFAQRINQLIVESVRESGSQ